MPNTNTEMNISDMYAQQAEQRLNDLKSQLIAQQNGKVFLLIDPFLRAPMEHEMLWQWLVEHPAKVVELPNEAIAAESYPLLLILDLNDAEHSHFARAMLLEAIEENQPDDLLAGKGRRICAFITSNVSVEQLSRHLGRQAILRREGKTALLRYYDPAVWQDVWSALMPEQRQRLMGPMMQWWSLDHTPQWQIYTNPVEPHATGRLWLRLPQWEWLERVGLTNRVINAHWQNTGSIPENARAKVRKALQSARLLGFESEHDLQAYAEHALAFGPEFNQHHLIKNLLNNRSEDVGYLEITAHLSTDDWQAIAQGQLLTHKTA